MTGTQLTPGDPRHVGRYTLLGRLGAGGMGVVYLGADEQGRRVAVKVMRQEFADDRQFRVRFAREAAALRAVASAHIVRVLETGGEDARPYLVTEYVAGEPLASRVAEHGPFGPNVGLRLARDLAAAMADIHAAGIVHRDLKPANVLLAPQGPKVIDFGIAQIADATALTRTGMVLGTPGYLAPEQITGGVQGPAVDVFTWGLTVIFATTGRPPFGTGPAEAVLYRVVHADPDVAGVPERLLPAIVAALHKDPALRP
uniref:serine/threonine-protein kinase n=1 Tax=Streptomyces phytophilus TaxID=722715 RepID=UPI0015F0694E